MKPTTNKKFKITVLLVLINCFLVILPLALFFERLLWSHKSRTYNEDLLMLEDIIAAFKKTISTL